MIEKPSILITSLGRTGTQFLARMFAELLPDAISLHEPDIYQNTGVANRLESYLAQVRRAGMWRMVVLKALGKWTLVKLSDARFSGRIDARGAVRSLLGQRSDFVRSMPGEVYVEANIGYYGLLDILPHTFARHRVLYFVRDGREWVRSHLNWGEAYNKRGLRRLISHNWPSPRGNGSDPSAAEWRGFSRFERLCWAWTRLNEYALDTLSLNPDVRVFRFEDVFLGDSRPQNLSELVSFATGHLPGVEHRMPPLGGQLERRSHGSSGAFPAWQGWTQSQQGHFVRLCGSLMERLGYDLG